MKITLGSCSKAPQDKLLVAPLLLCYSFQRLVILNPHFSGQDEDACVLYVVIMIKRGLVQIVDSRLTLEPKDRRAPVAIGL